MRNDDINLTLITFLYFPSTTRVLWMDYQVTNVQFVTICYMNKDLALYVISTAIY